MDVLCNEHNLKSKLPVRIYELLQKVGIDNAELLLLKTDSELQNLAPFTSKDLSILRSAAAEIILGHDGFLTARDISVGLQSRWKKLSTGCPIINKILDGGFSCRGITEIAGESRTGKTQFCLQLSLVVQYPEELGGFNAGAVYICTEDAFPSRRLQQLFDKFPSVFQMHSNHRFHISIPFADNIYIEHAADAESLVNIVVNNLPLLINTKKIGLIIIDSVGAVFRIEPVSPQRSSMMRAMAMELYKIANVHGITVICVNQVSSSLQTNSLVPCLGLSWANLVTTRIQLHRSGHENPDSVSKGVDLAIRHLQVCFSPSIPQNKIRYQVTEVGVQGIECNNHRS